MMSYRRLNSQLCLRALILLPLLMFLLGSDCDDVVHDLDGTEIDGSKKNTKPENKGDSKKDSKSDPLAEKALHTVCRWSNKRPVAPLGGAGVIEGIYDDKTCAYFVLPSALKVKLGGAKLNGPKTQEVCGEIERLQKQIEKRNRIIEETPDLVKRDPAGAAVYEKVMRDAKKELKEMSAEYEKLRNKNIFSEKLVLRSPVADLETEYQALNPDSAILFTPLLLMSFADKVTSKEGFLEEFSPYGYLYNMPVGVLNLRYPIACNKDEIEKIQISAYIGYSVNLGFAHYQLRLNLSKILDLVLAKATNTNQVSRSSFEELLKETWRDAAWKLEWLEEPQDVGTRHRIEQSLKIQYLKQIANAVGSSSRPSTNEAPRVRLGWHFDYKIDPEKVSKFKQDWAHDIIEKYKSYYFESGLVEIPYVLRD